MFSWAGPIKMYLATKFFAAALALDLVYDYEGQRAINIANVVLPPGD